MEPAQSNLTRLPPRQALLKLAIPLTTSMALETAFHFVNGYWVGQLGTNALAAMNLCSFSLWMMFAMAGTISTGCNAVIAQKIGAREEFYARRVAWCGVYSSVAWGALLLVLVHKHAYSYLSWQAGDHPEVGPVLENGAVYLRLVFWFAPVFCLNEVLSATLRAHGDTVTPLRVYSLGVALNFLLDPILMFGVGKTPGLGLSGAAYASGISFAVMAALFLWVLGSRLGYAQPAWAALPEVIRIGLPSSMTAVFFCLVYILISPTVGGYGPSALAALGLGHRVESFSYLISHGLSLASVTLVGQLIGAGQPRQAWKAALEACRLVSFFMLASSIIMLLMAEPLARIFSHDREVVERTALYLRWMTLAQWTTGLSVVLEGVMSGAGRPVFAMAASTFSASLRLPGSYWGSRLYGLPGIWIALIATRWIECILCILVFVRSSVWRNVPGADSQNEGFTTPR